MPGGILDTIVLTFTTVTAEPLFAFALGPLAGLLEEKGVKKRAVGTRPKIHGGKKSGRCTADGRWWRSPAFRPRRQRVQFDFWS